MDTDDLMMLDEPIKTPKVVKILDHALSYAARGWKVIPLYEIGNVKCSCGWSQGCKPGKHPRTYTGVKEATDDPQTIRRWWSQWPNANIGIATGRASGFVVIDLDGPEGIESWDNLRDGRSVETVEAITGSGGRHILFSLPAGVGVRNSAGTLGDRIDVRGDGGYIVASPSNHVSGRLYTWEASSDPADVPLAPLPQWLSVAIGNKSNASGVKSDPIPSSPVSDALNRCRAWLAHAPAAIEGQGGDLLTFKTAGHVLSFGVSEDEALDLMSEWNTRCDPPWDMPALQNKISSAARNGTPRSSKGNVHTAVEPIGIIDFGGVVRDTPPATREALSFDLSRLPKHLVSGLSGLSSINPMLPVGSQVLVPFVFAGALIGKRFEALNMANKYYPNIWNIVLAASGANKTGTKNVLIDAVPGSVLLPDGATFEALLEKIGHSITTKTKQGARPKSEIAAEIDRAIAEDKETLNGGLIVADEATGTLDLLLGGDGKNADRNLPNVLRLATSGERFEQPRIGSGLRLTTDLCVSLVGFSQPSVWNTRFGTDTYLSSGFVGRIIPCCEGVKLLNLPPADPHDWKSFVAVVKTKTLDGWDSERQIVLTATRDSDTLKPAINTLVTTAAYKRLVELLGEETAGGLASKIIGHGVKLAMICKWVSGNAVTEYTPACMELVAVCFANYFSVSYGSSNRLGVKEMTALAFIQSNPGCSLNEVRRKLNFRYAMDAQQVVETLVEAGKLEIRDGKRANAKSLYLK